MMSKKPNLATLSLYLSPFSRAISPMHFGFAYLLVSGTLAIEPMIKRATEPCHYEIPGKNDAHATLIPDEYLVGFRDEYTIEEHFQFLGQNLSHEAEKFEYMSPLNMYFIRTDEMLIHTQIRYDPGVEFVSHHTTFNVGHDWIASSNATEPVHKSKIQKRWNTETILSPPDQIMTGIWGYQESVTDSKWGKLDRLTDAGKGVNAYVMDTGINDYNDAFLQVGGSLSNFKKKYFGNDYYDVANHGTQVASILLRNAWCINLINVKVIQEGVSEVANIVQAISDIVDEHISNTKSKNSDWKGSIINMSFGVGHTEALQKAIEGAMKAGVNVVAAAGDKGSSDVDHPCAYKGVVCVGALDYDYSRAGFSNRGHGVTLFAPGRSIVSAHDVDYVASDTCTGTGCAAPAVTAAMAIFMSFESITSDPGKVFKRLTQNWQVNLLYDVESNFLLHFGLQHPSRDKRFPYNGVDPKAVKDGLWNTTDTRESPNMSVQLNPISTSTPNEG